MADVPLAERVEALEAKVVGLEQLPAQIARLESVLREEIRSGDDETRRSLRQEIRDGDEETRRSLRQEIRDGDEETRRSLRQEIRDGDEETRRQMRVLHEDLVGRIKTIGEAIDRAPRRRKPGR